MPSTLHPSTAPEVALALQRRREGGYVVPGAPQVPKAHTGWKEDGASLDGASRAEVPWPRWPGEDRFPQEIKSLVLLEERGV